MGKTGADRLFAGRYELVESLGGGAQGLAIRCRDTLGDRRDAVLKLGLSGRESLDGTIREFEALRALATPYTAPVIDLGFTGPADMERVAAILSLDELTSATSRPFLVRQWVEGDDVVAWASALREGGEDVPLDRVVEVLAQVTEGIADLHRAGIIHGDLKPDHVIVAGDGERARPVLIDFGLAAQGDRGTLGGTVGYLAPERLRGQPAARASDRFALGVILAQVLCGARIEVHCATSTDDLPGELQARSLPERLRRTIRRLLDPEPQRRPSLDSVRTSLLPPSKAVEGWRSLHDQSLPFLGIARRALIASLVDRALSASRASVATLPPVVVLTGPAGGGRSRALRQLGWALQGRGRPAFEVRGCAAPMGGLLDLGPQMASLAGVDFSAPTRTTFVGDRARWIREVAETLAEVVPPTGVAVLWDDLGERINEGPDAVEAMIKVVEQSRGRVRLWTTTTPDRVPELRGLFASAGFELVTLPALIRADLDGLLGLSHRGRPLSHGDLNRLYRLSLGLPARLSALLAQDDPTSAANDLGESWVTALAGLVAGGVTQDDLELAAGAVGVGIAEMGSLLSRALATGRVNPGPPRMGGTRRTFQARAPNLRGLSQQVRTQLASALSAMGSDQPATKALAAALRFEPDWVARHFRPDGATTASLVGRGPLLVVLELLLESNQTVELLDAYVETVLDGAMLGRGRRVLAALCGEEVGCGAEVLVARARLAFAAGDQEVVSTLVDRAEASGLDGVNHARSQHLLAQVELRRGRYASARQRATDAAQALNSHGATAESLRAELWVTAAAAAAFLGEQGREALDAARETLATLAVSPRVRARHLALSAVAATLRGDLDEATKGYQAALEIVEEEGLDADRPLYLLNLGTAYERQVRLSMARRYYELGVRCCLPTTRPSTRSLLLANHANLDVRLGRTAEARELLGAASRIAREADLASVSRFVRHLEADADAADGNLEAAAVVLTTCADAYRAAGDRRHACELSLSAGLASIRSGDVASAQRAGAAAEQAMGDFPDLVVRGRILRAELTCDRGGLAAACGVDDYLRALESALEAGDDLTVLDNARWLRRRMRTMADGDRPDPLAIEELRAIVDRAWRRVALGLSPELRRDLARHLDLPTLRGSESSPDLWSATRRDSTDSDTSSALRVRSASPLRLPDLTAKFYRMLSLNRRILGESNRQRLIPAALDIALELSGAERGFLLLRRGDGPSFEVAFSRDVDGRPISDDHLEISETVAQQVASTGQPVVTVDASEDERFGKARSIHQLQLTSILCLPIKDRGEILGCLYLDHRTRPGVFDDEVPHMLGAYADQVAIALVILARTGEIQRERDRLAEAQARIEALLKDKEDLLMNLETRCEGLEADLARERSASGLRYSYEHMIADSPPMRRVLAQIDRVVDAAIPVVIQGESGTGKELVARAIHFNGPRSARAFVAVNCGALSEELLASELFGHKKGAFTGAISDRRGLFETASGGTLFLDEIGEMSLLMQVKLLRAVQEQRVRPVGSSQEISVDVRIVAATHRDLLSMVEAGTFRRDLFFRLATIIIALPPLRDRSTDIPLLIRATIRRHCEEAGRAEPEVDGSVVRLLMKYSWPGNIRQLENVIRAALIMSEGSLGVETIRPLLIGLDDTPNLSTPSPSPRMGPSPLGRPVKCTAQDVREAMQGSGGNRRGAADLLGVSLRTLQRYLRKYELA